MNTLVQFIRLYIYYEVATFRIVDIFEDELFDRY